jgi:hypothetical protein
MNNELAADIYHERYVVEIDGVAKAEYRIFAQALRAGLDLRREFPLSSVKVRDIDEKPSLAAH